MRIAILTDTDTTFVEFPEPVFREMLKQLLPEYDYDVDETLDYIETLLKQLTITK